MTAHLDRTISKGYGPSAARYKLALLLGLALAPVPALAEAVTVAILGDSLVQGYGLPQEDGLVPQLQRWLDATGAEVEVLNAGVSGDTTAGGASRVDWTLTPEVDALVVALGGNDLLRGIDPEVSRKNLETIVSTAGDRDVPVLLVAIEAPGNYGPDYKAAFDGMYADLAAEYDTALHPGFFTAFTDEVDTGTAMETFMQPDGIHPNREGVAAIVETFGPSVVDLAEMAR